MVVKLNRRSLQHTFMLHNYCNLFNTTEEELEQESAHLYAPN
jgi:hypothetical protein